MDGRALSESRIILATPSAFWYPKGGKADIYIFVFSDFFDVPFLMFPFSQALKNIW